MGDITRRDILKKGAVAGGLVWTLPVVTSIATPAGAQVGTPCPRDCTANATGLIVKIPQDGSLVSAAFDTGPDPCVVAADTGFVTTAFGTVRVQGTTVCAEASDSECIDCKGLCTASASIQTLTVTGTALDELSLPNPIVATGLTSQASADCNCTIEGSSNVASLQLGGEEPQLNLSQCNRAIGPVIIIGEKTCVDGILTVRALHIVIPGLLEVVAAESSAGGPGCPCPTPLELCPPA